MSQPEVVREQVSIPSRRGRLVGELAYPLGLDPVGAVLALNPHPLMGGRADNNLIAALAEHLPALGLLVMRFDYEGAGTAPTDLAAAMNEFWSTGRSGGEPLMIDDALACRSWLERQHAGPIVPVGYSFGAYVATRIVPADAPALVLVSPTIEAHDFRSLAGRRHPTLVVSGENDFATRPAALRAWLAALGAAVEHQTIDGGEHFFRGRERAVAELCGAFVIRHLCGAEVSAC